MTRAALVPVLLATLLVHPDGGVRQDGVRAGTGPGEEAGGETLGRSGAPGAPLLASRDSALDEMRVGRFWHAARILREDGAARSDDPADVLLLSQAEAGWKNWPEVARLLSGRSWLGSRSGGEGWFLLARAREEAQAWEAAVEAYRAFLDVAAGADPQRTVAEARLVRVAVEASEGTAAVAAVDALPASVGWLGSWAALQGAEIAGADGDTATVAALLARVREPEAADASWRVLPRAILAAGDTAGARDAWLAARTPGSESRRAEATTEAGRLTLVLGDSARALSLLQDGLDGGSLRTRGRAAEALLSFDGLDLSIVLRMASALNRLGDGRNALRAYDRAAALARRSEESLSHEVRLARARLMATVRSRQGDALEEFRALREADPEPDLGARNLEAWTALRRRQGRTAEVAVLRRWLLEEYPTSSQAAELLWDRASGAESRGERTEALRQYAALAEAVPSHVRAGQARMRMGQIHLGRGDAEEAAGVYEAYLEDFPRGGRWEEASYWAARARMEAGDTAAARRLVARVRTEEPVSYYAVMGADLLGQPYDVDVPEGPAPVRPEWLTEGLARLDLLEASGLTDAASAQETALIAQARAQEAVVLTLAEELIHRGRTVAGINLGWDLRREGAAWDRRLLQVVYPFPYRELVIREAREWGLDPVMLAALIRQESAFKADIRSHAGAVGLMQVMPPTGAELARRHGPSGFHENNLEAPEVNLHLGAAFFRDMSRRYDNDLPLVLSAYNAGPTRATRWKRYPEASDPLRFTERIPFDETRGYVKNVRRNMGLYQVLYSPE